MNEPKCPKCGTNDHVHLVSTFTKTGTVVGVAAGAAGTMGGAATGAAFCSVVPVVGTAIGAIGGGIIGALMGATAGGAVGYGTGNMVDKAFGKYKCEKCGCEFESESTNEFRTAEDSGLQESGREPECENSSTRPIVFISYKRDEFEKINPVCKMLDELRVPYWIDRKGVHGGDDYRGRITRTMKEVRVVLFFSSKLSNQSDNVRKEIALAGKYEKSIVPILLDQSEYAESIEYELAGVNKLDIADLDGIRQAVRSKLGLL